MKYDKKFNPVQEYTAPLVEVVTLVAENLMTGASQIEDYDENIIC